MIIARFNDRSLALSYALEAVKPLRVMLGDDGRFWIVTPKTAARLERDGYCYAL
jgi:hypothetical protein